MKLSKKITATAAATVLASAALLTPVANAQEEGGSPAPEAPAEGDNGAGEEQPGAGEEQPGEGDENGNEDDQTGDDSTEDEPAGSSNMSKEDKIAAGVGGTIVGLGVLGAVLGNAGDKGEDKAEDEAEAPKEGEKEAAPAEGEGKPEAPAADEEAPAKEDIEAPAAEAPAEGEAEAPAAEAPAADAEAPAEPNVQLANTGVKPEISILAGLALVSMVAGAWMMFARRQA